MRHPSHLPRNFISPYRKGRSEARAIIGGGNFFEIFLNAPFEVCEQRDPKGLYKKARSGEIPQFTGISDPYEIPDKPDLSLDTATRTARSATDLLLDELIRQGVLE